MLGESSRVPGSLRIGIDVDDVLTESLPGYLDAFRRYFGHDVRIEDAAWEIFRRYPQISPIQVGEFFAELEAADFLGTRPVYPDAVEAIRRLAAAGHRLIVVTGRLMTHKEHTRRLLQELSILECFEDLVHLATGKRRRSISRASSARGGSICWSKMNCMLLRLWCASPFRSSCSTVPGTRMICREGSCA